MRVFALLFMLNFLGCSQRTNDNVPKFIRNANKSDIYKDVKGIVLEKDFSIVFFTRTHWSYGWYKIFALKRDNWEKIEILQNVIDTTELKKDKEYSALRDIVTRRMCRPEEAHSFLKKLIELHFFDIEEEGEILDKCKAILNNDVSPDPIDGPTFYLQIISGNKVRSLKFYYPHSRLTKCPSMKEWKNLLDIEKLFETEW